MTSNVINRKTIRAKWGELLAAATSIPVYAYQKGNFGGLSPVFRVLVLDSRRERAAMGVTDATNADIHIIFELFVARADASKSWDEDDVDDKLDDMEKIVSDLVIDNVQVDGFWNYAEQAGESVITPFQDLGGNPYIREVISVLTKVQHV